MMQTIYLTVWVVSNGIKDTNLKANHNNSSNGIGY